jgi:hypothetical protein
MQLLGNLQTAEVCQRSTSQFAEIILKWIARTVLKVHPAASYATLACLRLLLPSWKPGLPPRQLPHFACVAAAWLNRSEIDFSRATIFLASLYVIVLVSAPNVIVTSSPSYSSDVACEAGERGVKR